jgi:uncharacterized protein (AIM24 family)
MYRNDQLPEHNKNAHEIDFEIFGEEMQYVEIELDPQEGVIAEAGSFMMMDDGIKMETIFGDGSKNDTGFLGKIFGAGKRLLTGESLFMTAFIITLQENVKLVLHRLIQEKLLLSIY